MPWSDLKLRWRPPLRADWRGRGGWLAGALIALVLVHACAPSHRPGTPSPLPAHAPDRDVRIAVRTGVPSVVLSATGGWWVEGASSPGASYGRRDQVTVAARGGALMLTDASGRVLPAGASLAARTLDGSTLLTADGRRYRGRFTLYAQDDGVLLVNHLPLEEYLRGVVPLEIGPRTGNERAAVEAQAITARSYARIRLRPESATRYDLVGTVMNQVYGGADAESPLSDEAVRATRGLVLTFAGRIVDAVYHSTCGGTTAGASEVWRSGDQPYLRVVSDRIPASTRHYCDISPRFRWTREFTGAELATVLGRYLRDYATVGASGPGTPQRLEIDGRTASGRVRALVISTSRGRYELRGNDIRFVLRDSGGAILGSTYFSLENETAGGSLTRLTVLGAGFGHGIGMCQWGAIGRARAGQDARTILETYYPGTRVEQAG